MQTASTPAGYSSNGRLAPLRLRRTSPPLLPLITFDNPKDNDYPGVSESPAIRS